MPNNSNFQQNSDYENLDNFENHNILCIDKFFSNNENAYMKKQIFNFFKHQNVDKIVTKVNCSL